MAEIERLEMEAPSDLLIFNGLRQALDDIEAGPFDGAPE